MEPLKLIFVVHSVGWGCMYLEGQSTKARVAVHGHVPTMHDMGLGWVTDILNISEFFFWEFELE